MRLIQHLESFVLSFKNGNNDLTRNSFNKYYIPLVEIKDFNALIDNKAFFDQQVKNLSKCQEMMTIQQDIYWIISLNEADDSKFETRKWNIVNDNSKANYEEGKEITEVSKSNLCDYNDAYILIRGDITVTASPQIQVAFKNCAPFTQCITNIDGATIDDAENLHLVMPMYNLIEHSSNYSETAESLWFYFKDELSTFNNNVANTDNFKSFKYKAKLLENTVAQSVPNAVNGIFRKATITVPLKQVRTMKIQNGGQALEKKGIFC